MSSEQRDGSWPRRVGSVIGHELRSLLGMGWFRLGLALRVAAVLLLVPGVQADWFVPFLTGFLRSPDPYASFLARGGDLPAWPYGPVMTLAHLPTALLGLVEPPLWLTSASFGTTLIAADVATVLALRQLAPAGTSTLVSKIWWLSPAGLVISYWHGQTDAVPLALLLGALTALGERRFRLGGTLAGLSIAAKLTMAVAAPFFLIWLVVSRRHSEKLWDVFVPLTAIPAVSYGAYLLSPSAWSMLTGSPVLNQATETSISLHGVPIMVLPAVLVALLYVAARARRLGFDLMLGILGTALFAMAAVLTVAPGWWLWALPFLGLYAAKCARVEVTWGVWVFSLLLAVQTVIGARGADLVFLPLGEPAVPGLVESASLTLVVSVGFVLATSMFRHMLADNDPYGLARRPLLIGLAGPSGSGKDTLSTALARVFGEREVVGVSGDDYHKWERAAPMWRVWTHLNPAANRLREFTDDVLALTEGRSIQCRYYDHHSGRFEPRRSKHYNDVVLVSGLHTLYGPELRNALDVKIYLDMDEQLRRHLKLARDTTERGQSREEVERSIERREPDFRRYIQPQAAHADLVLRLEPRDPDELGRRALGEPLALRLQARVRSGLRIDEVARLLSVCCFCEADIERADGSGEALFRCDGDDISGEDVREMVELLVPDHEELVAVTPHFEGGVTGVMQLLVLMQVGVVRNKDARSARA